MNWGFIPDEEPVRGPDVEHVYTDDDSGAGLVALLFFSALGVVLAWQFKGKTS